MVDSIFWARKLTKQLNINQATNPPLPRRGWMSQRILAESSRWGVRYPCEVYIFDLDAIANFPINHMIMSYVKIGQSKKIEIFVNAVSNHCWQRFYIFKELIHVLSSNESNVTIGCEHLIEVITNLHDDNFKSMLQDQAYRVEIEATWGAIELLLPKEIVEKEEKIIGGWKNFSDKSINEIAQKYKIPKVIVRARLTHEYIRDVFDNCYKSTFYQNAEFLAIPSK